MDISGVIAIAQRVHDTERMNFGSNSTRDGRNADWARIIGIVHHGHPVYNPTPDAAWCLKNGGNGRPQSDDVVVHMPDRTFYDCIPNSGLNHYTFTAHRDPNPLPMEQNVYPPPVPAGGGGSNPVVVPTPANDVHWTDAHTRIYNEMRALQQPVGLQDGHFVQRLAEQFCFTFREAWGMKRADASRPVSGNALALLSGQLYAYIVVPERTGQRLTITGQVFVAVVGIDHLQTGPVVEPVDPVDPVDPDPGIPVPTPDPSISARLNEVRDSLLTVTTTLTTLMAEVTDLRAELKRGYQINASTRYLGPITGSITPKD